MKVQSINNNAPSFSALNITAEAKALIEKEKGGKKKIAQYTKELANSRWDLNIKKCSYSNDIMPYFGNNRYCCVIPSRVQDKYVMVYSGEVGGDNEDDIVDCLKFASAERAKEVYETLDYKVPITWIRKKKGGKADSLNMAINASNYPYFILLQNGIPTFLYLELCLPLELF